MIKLNEGKLDIITQQRGVPKSHLVHCYHAKTGELMAKKWSNDDGFVCFDNLIKGVKYLLVMVDRVTDDEFFNVVGQDLVVAQ